MRMRREAGQSMVELAILMPLLLLILLGCLDLGRAFSIWLTMANASREGARYGCTRPDKTGQIEARVEDEILAEGLQLESLTKEVSTPEGTEPGDPIRVTAAYSVPVLTTYLFGGQPLSIRASAQMAIIESGG